MPSDAAGDELGGQEEAFVWRVVEDVLEDLAGSTQVTLAQPASAPDADPDRTSSTPSPIQIVGIAVEDTSDVLVLKMLGQLIAPTGCVLEIITDVESPLELADRVAEHSPRLVVLSHLPPRGLAQARYLVRRLRARLDSLPLIVGRWSGVRGGSAAGRLLAVGATHVVSTLAEARDRVLAAAQKPTAEPVALRSQTNAERAQEPRNREGILVTMALEQAADSAAIVRRRCFGMNLAVIIRTLS